MEWIINYVKAKQTLWELENVLNLCNDTMRDSTMFSFYIIIMVRFKTETFGFNLYYLKPFGMRLPVFKMPHTVCLKKEVWNNKWSLIWSSVLFGSKTIPPPFSAWAELCTSCEVWSAFPICHFLMRCCFGLDFRIRTVTHACLSFGLFKGNVFHWCPCKYCHGKTEVFTSSLVSCPWEFPHACCKRCVWGTKIFYIMTKYNNNLNNWQLSAIEWAWCELPLSASWSSG